jgi:hypothetical protein
MTRTESESLTINSCGLGQFCLLLILQKHLTIDNQINQIFYQGGNSNSEPLKSIKRASCLHE